MKLHAALLVLLLGIGGAKPAIAKPPNAPGITATEIKIGQTNAL